MEGNLGPEPSGRCSGRGGIHAQGRAAVDSNQVPGTPVNMSANTVFLVPATSASSRNLNCLLPLRVSLMGALAGDSIDHDSNLHFTNGFLSTVITHCSLAISDLLAPRYYATIGLSDFATSVPR